MKIDNRIWGILTLLAVVALLAGGWFIGASPFIDAMNSADDQRQDAIARNQQLQAELVALEKAKQDLPDLEDQAALLEQSIPADTESSAFITSLNDMAGAYGVTITSIQMDDGQPYAVPPEAAAG